MIGHVTHQLSHVVKEILQASYYIKKTTALKKVGLTGVMANG